MAPIDEGSELTRPQPPVEPSAPMELLWLGHQILNRRPGVLDRFDGIGGKRADRIAERLRSFWGDGVSGGAGELVVLADYAGLLFATSLDEILDDLPASAVDLSRVGLSAESSDDRRRFIERLTRLRHEPDVRRRYAGVLRDLWEPMRPEWESEGLAEVLSICKRIGQRLELGAPLPEVVPAVAAVSRKKPEWRSLIDEAAGSGKLALIPGYFGGSWSIWDLPHHVVVSFSAGADPLADAKSSGQRLAPRLRALGDPTRLSILLYLAERATSVGEVARRFELAQPTVSAHLRALRGAGLVTGTRSDGRTVYRVEQDRLLQLLRDLAESSGVDLST
ncbi:MAG: metalloregulator ArsR/SmtB family transcription factor [Candidatus Dormiibacterota bacterium]|jgi:DNA-binding transcriptional ArsR family regulator